eukprot:TRINITY_DN24601_c0_g1_i1.p1 TRINITY_DN24601_c0_g1~~TRINITY_DN24601_c0_g1_i1.p1  ORF type:complete len:559 (-),score=92.58 TRINITY_DN24601_c0_g1_i1:327-2003(-)
MYVVIADAVAKCGAFADGEDVALQWCGAVMLPSEQITGIVKLSEIYCLHYGLTTICYCMAPSLCGWKCYTHVKPVDLKLTLTWLQLPPPQSWGMPVACSSFLPWPADSIGQHPPFRCLGSGCVLELSPSKPHFAAFTDLDGFDPANGSRDTCPEGFRCVSRVSRFGRNHIGEVLNVPDTSATSGEPELYEWNCPFQNKWKENRFSSGNGETQCKDDKDCLCIQRGSPNMRTEFRNGEELIIGDFKTASGEKPGKTDVKSLHVVPHYQMRDFGRASQDDAMTLSQDPKGRSSDQHAESDKSDHLKLHLDNPHVGLGNITSLDHKHWLDRYKDTAEKMQFGLDSYHDAIEKSYQEQVRPATEAALEQSDSAQNIQIDLMKIRRFQILSGDCVNMRDTVAKLAPKLAEGGFASSFKNCEGCPDQELKCFKEGDKCRQLNCYVGFHGQPFLQRMQQLKTKLESRVVEQSAPVGSKYDDNDGEDTLDATVSHKDEAAVHSDGAAADATQDNQTIDHAESPVKGASLRTEQVIATALLRGPFPHAQSAGNQRATSRLSCGLAFL